MPPASEQVPKEEQDVGQGGEAGRGPDHHVAQQVDLRTGPGVQPVGDVGLQRDPVQRRGAVLVLRVIASHRQHPPLQLREPGHEAQVPADVHLRG